MRLQRSVRWANARAEREARKIRRATGNRELRFSIDAAFDFYGRIWVASRLPAGVAACCDVEAGVVIVSRRLRPRSRRYYLCRELIRMLHPGIDEHTLDEVAAYVLVPPWRMKEFPDRSIGRIAKEFDVPIWLALQQARFAR